MSKNARQAQLKMIPIAAIEVLNPRERNQRIFDDIVGNIKQIGLKMNLPLFDVPLSRSIMRPSIAVPRASFSQIASG